MKNFTKKLTLCALALAATESLFPSAAVSKLVAAGVRTVTTNPGADQAILNQIIEVAGIKRAPKAAVVQAVSNVCEQPVSKDAVSSLKVLSSNDLAQQSIEAKIAAWMKLSANQPVAQPVSSDLVVLGAQNIVPGVSEGASALVGSMASTNIAPVANSGTLIPHPTIITVDGKVLPNNPTFMKFWALAEFFKRNATQKNFAIAGAAVVGTAAVAGLAYYLWNAKVAADAAAVASEVAVVTPAAVAAPVVEVAEVVSSEAVAVAAENATEGLQLAQQEIAANVAANVAETSVAAPAVIAVPEIAQVAQPTMYAQIAGYVGAMATAAEKAMQNAYNAGLAQMKSIDVAQAEKVAEATAFIGSAAGVSAVLRVRDAARKEQIAKEAQGVSEVALQIADSK